MRPHRTVFSTRRDSPRRVDARLRLRACRSRSRISETNRGSKCSITCCQGIQKSIMVECRERPPIIKKHTHSRFSKFFVQQKHYYTLLLVVWWRQQHDQQEQIQQNSRRTARTNENNNSKQQRQYSEKRQAVEVQDATNMTLRCPAANSNQKQNIWHDRYSQEVHLHPRATSLCRHTPRPNKYIYIYKYIVYILKRKKKGDREHAGVRTPAIRFVAKRKAYS